MTNNYVVPKFTLTPNDIGIIEFYVFFSKYEGGGGSRTKELDKGASGDNDNVVTNDK